MDNPIRSAVIVGHCATEMPRGANLVLLSERVTRVCETANNSDYKTAEAWAVASMAPARPGTRGYCASAWAITYDCWATTLNERAVPSSAPNRNEWLAGIMAIRGVLENVAPRTRLTIYVSNKALADCYRTNWVSSQGKPQKEADAAAPIFQLRDELRLDLIIAHRPLDWRAEMLKTKARLEAQKKDKTLSDEERDQIPPCRQPAGPSKKKGFPPTDDEQ